MSAPTPRTDEAYAKWQEGWDRTPFGPDLARTLERELAAERAKTADCGLTIASLCDGILGEDFADRSDRMLIRVGCRMKAELAAEREKVRVLRSALQDLCDEQNGAPLERRREQWQEAMDNAVAALALSPYP